MDEEAGLTCFVHFNTIFALQFTSCDHFVLNIQGKENIEEENILKSDLMHLLSILYFPRTSVHIYRVNRPGISECLRNRSAHSCCAGGNRPGGSCSPWMWQRGLDLKKKFIYKWIYHFCYA